MPLYVSAAGNTRVKQPYMHVHKRTHTHTHIHTHIHTQSSAWNNSKQPQRAHVTPLLTELHWLPVAARIKFKSLLLAYRMLAGSAPIYLNALVRANVTPR